MKAVIISITGTKTGEIKLPVQFEEEIRPDLIKRAVLSIQSHKRQPYGTDPEAGKKFSSKLSRRRRDYKGAYGIGISRVPRKILNYRGSRFNWQGATAPNTVGGRQAHPPKSQKIFSKKINKQERRKAIRSAMTASVTKELVISRGHLVGEYPVVLDSNVEKLDKTKKVIEFLQKLGLKQELERSSKKRTRTGNPRRRGRHYKKRKGPLLVVSGMCELINAAKNIPGVEITEIQNLNTELLAPGCDCGRLTLYTKAAIELIDKNKLFTQETRKSKK